jgi:hypothetical protein
LDRQRARLRVYRIRPCRELGAQHRSDSCNFLPLTWLKAGCAQLSTICAWTLGYPSRSFLTRRRFNLPSSKPARRTPFVFHAGAPRLDGYA